MSEPIFWSDVKIEVGLTEDTALVITGITKANPGVVTYTGADPVNGKFVRLKVNGMVELSDRVFRIANVSSGGNTFELEGEDTSGYRTFISGNAYPTATLASMTTVQDVQVDGGEPEFADLTTVHNSVRRRAPTVFSPTTCKFGCIFDSSDPAMARLVSLSKKKQRESIVFTFSDGQQFSFYSYVAATGGPTGAAQEVVKTNVSLEAQGLPNVYAPFV